MPRDQINTNINSKENNFDRSDIDEIIKAGRALTISAHNFVSALEKFANKLDTLSENEESDSPSASPANVASAIPHDFFLTDKQPSTVPSYSKLNHGKAQRVNKTLSEEQEQDQQKEATVQQKWGIRINDIVQVQNTLIIRGYTIPAKYKYGKVTHFNKRFVFFDVKYKRGNIWYTEPCWREHQNLAVYRQL